MRHLFQEASTKRGVPKGVFGDPEAPVPGHKEILSQETLRENPEVLEVLPLGHLPLHAPSDHTSRPDPYLVDYRSPVLHRASRQQCKGSRTQEEQ